MPARGPEPISARSPAILVSDTASTFSAPDSSTSASRLAWASKGSFGASIWRRPDSLRRRGRTRAANFGCVFSPVPVAVPPSGIWPDVHERGGDPLLGERDLGGVAAELLAERHGYRVHQVGAARLDHVLEAAGLACQRAFERLQRRQQVVLRQLQRRQLDRRGEHVVGGLTHVDVVVGVHPAAGQGGDDLVGVRVRGGARAGLEDVDRELAVVLPGGDLAARPARSARRSLSGAARVRR